MNVGDLQTMFDYGYWANDKYFAAMAAMTPEQFTQDIAGGYGSVRDTLVHMMSAEWGWLDRCGGPRRGPALQPADYPTLASVIERWAQLARQMHDFLSALSDDDLNRDIEFAFGDGPKHVRTLGDLMRHAANHSVHHRGQVGLLLRMLGVAPGNVDYLFYTAEARQ